MTDGTPAPTPSPRPLALVTGASSGIGLELARLLPPTRDDDVAMVAVRLHRQDEPRPPEAGPQRVPPEVPAEPPQEPRSA